MTLLIASIIAPPILIKSFQGEYGMKRNHEVKEEEPGCQVKLEFPTRPITEFIRSRIIEAFNNEEFFVHRLNLESQIYHIRKEDIFITLMQKDNNIEICTTKDNRPLVVLIVTEELLELKDLLEGAQKLKSPDGMCEALVTGLFSDDE